MGAYQASSLNATSKDQCSGYSRICAQNNITRIGCWDHAHRKFVEASKAAKPKQVKLSKADMALSMINKLYAIERGIKDLSVADRYQMRQKHSIPQLNNLKAWLDKNTPRVMKKPLTRTAMDYTLNQWEYLTGYCEPAGKKSMVVCRYITRCESKRDLLLTH